MNNSKLQQARFSDDYKYIIDCNGKKLNYDDPRVVHVWAWWEMPYFSGIIKNILEKRGWRCRTAGKVTHKTIEDARKVCSGRECMSFTAFAGAVCHDIVENRDNDEVTLYYFLNQQGPCKNALWPDMWKIFGKRLGVQNAIFCAFPTLPNNYLGQGTMFALEFAAAVILSDLFQEAENVVRCLARDRDEALKILALEAGKVTLGFKRNLLAVELALKKWAKKVADIRLKDSIAQTPKVLILGTGDVEVIHDPVTNYFIEHGIIPKKLDLLGFIYFLTSEDCSRVAFRRGAVLLKDQYKWSPFLRSFFHPETKFKEAFLAMQAEINLLTLDFMRKRYHVIAKASGLLLSDNCISLKNIALEGNKIATANAFTETFQAAGGYMLARKSDAYDGLMNLCTFDCQPSVNAQAITRPLAAKEDLPYAAIDMEGPWLSASQTRVLEALSVQARRYHAQR